MVILLLRVHLLVFNLKNASWIYFGRAGLFCIHFILSVLTSITHWDANSCFSQFSGSEKISHDRPLGRTLLSCEGAQSMQMFYLIKQNAATLQKSSVTDSFRDPTNTSNKACFCLTTQVSLNIFIAMFPCFILKLFLGILGVGEAWSLGMNRKAAEKLKCSLKWTHFILVKQLKIEGT